MNMLMWRWHCWSSWLNKCQRLCGLGTSSHISGFLPISGIKMVQADDPDMIEISKKYKNKVLFCVVE